MSFFDFGKKKKKQVKIPSQDQIVTKNDIDNITRIINRDLPIILRLLKQHIKGFVVSNKKNYFYRESKEYPGYMEFRCYIDLGLVNIYKFYEDWDNFIFGPFQKFEDDLENKLKYDRVSYTLYNSPQNELVSVDCDEGEDEDGNYSFWFGCYKAYVKIESSLSESLNYDIEKYDILDEGFFNNNKKKEPTDGCIIDKATMNQIKNITDRDVNKMTSVSKKFIKGIKIIKEIESIYEEDKEYPGYMKFKYVITFGVLKVNSYYKDEDDFQEDYDEKFAAFLVDKMNYKEVTYETYADPNLQKVYFELDDYNNDIYKFTIGSALCYIKKDSINESNNIKSLLEQLEIFEEEYDIFNEGFLKNSKDKKRKENIDYYYNKYTELITKSFFIQANEIIKCIKNGNETENLKERLLDAIYISDSPFVWYFDAVCACYFFSRLKMEKDLKYDDAKEKEKLAKKKFGDLFGEIAKVQTYIQVNFKGRPEAKEVFDELVNNRKISDEKAKNKIRKIFS